MRKVIKKEFDLIDSLNLHFVWQKFNAKFMTKENKWKYTGYRMMCEVEEWAKTGLKMCFWNGVMMIAMPLLYWF